MTTTNGSTPTDKKSTDKKFAVDQAVKVAQSLPDLINKLQQVDPGFAQQLIGKSLLASKSPWGTLLVAGAAYLSTKYGLGWNETTDDLVAAAGLIVGSYIMRWVTKAPIASVLPKPSGEGTMKASMILAAGLTLSLLGACTAPVSQNPLADAPTITINPTTGQATSGAATVAPVGADPLTQVAYLIGNQFSPDDSTAINLSTGANPAAPTDQVGRSCWVDLAKLSDSLNGAGAGAATSGLAPLTLIETLRLQMLSIQNPQGNPLLLTALSDCIAMGRQSVAMGLVLPAQFQGLIAQMAVAAATSPSAGGLPIPAAVKVKLK